MHREEYRIIADNCTPHMMPGATLEEAADEAIRRKADGYDRGIELQKRFGAWDWRTISL